MQPLDPAPSMFFLTKCLFKNLAHILSFLIIELWSFVFVFFFKVLGISHLVDIEFENISLLL